MDYLYYQQIKNNNLISYELIIKLAQSNIKSL